MVAVPLGKNRSVHILASNTVVPAWACPVFVRRWEARIQCEMGMQAFLINLCLLWDGDLARIPKVLRPCSELTRGVRRISPAIWCLGDLRPASLKVLAPLDIGH